MPLALLIQQHSSFFHKVFPSTTYPIHKKKYAQNTLDKFNVNSSTLLTTSPSHTQHLSSPSKKGSKMKGSSSRARITFLSLLAISRACDALSEWAATTRASRSNTYPYGPVTTHPINFLHFWFLGRKPRTLMGVRYAVFGAPHQCHLGSVASYLINADVRALR